MQIVASEEVGFLQKGKTRKKKNDSAAHSASSQQKPFIPHKTRMKKKEKEAEENDPYAHVKK